MNQVSRAVFSSTGLTGEDVTSKVTLSLKNLPVVTAITKKKKKKKKIPTPVPCNQSQSPVTNPSPL
jgi:hypothetical protein